MSAETSTELRELMEKASPRPWSARVGGVYADDVWVASDAQRPWEDHMALKLWSRTMGRGDYEIDSPEHKVAIANAQLLCAAVNALPALLSRIEELEGAICRAVDSARPYKDESGVVEVSLHPFGGLMRIRDELARAALNRTTEGGDQS